MEDEDTQVGPPPRDPDTARDLVAAMCADTAEWDDTDREVEAQGTLDVSPAMFEDTGVVIVDRPVSEPHAASDKLVVTFRTAQPTVRFRDPTPAPPLRASTQGEWPPQPRLPAITAPRLREPKRAGVYTIVHRPETKN